MNRPTKLQRDIHRFIRRTDSKSDQIRDTIKDFVETTDDMADRICHTVKKVLTTTDDTTDIIYEALKKVLSNEDTFRNKIAGLLDSEDLSEEELHVEIRRFLDMAAEKGKTSIQESGKRRFRDAADGDLQESVNKLLQMVEEKTDKTARGIRAFADTSSDLSKKLNRILESQGISADELKSKINDLLDSMTQKTERAADMVSGYAEEGAEALKRKLNDLMGNKALSSEDFKHNIAELLKHYEQPEERAGSSAEDREVKFAKELDHFLNAHGTFYSGYEQHRDFQEPVSGRMLMALVSFLAKRKRPEQAGQQMAKDELSKKSEHEPNERLIS